MSSVLARRESLLACGGFEASLPLAQDWDLWLRLAPEWELAVLPAPLTLHRRHPAQRSAQAVQMRCGEGEVLARAWGALPPGNPTARGGAPASGLGLLSEGEGPVASG